MESQYDAVASLIARLKLLPDNCGNAGTIIATPQILKTGNPDLNLAGIIQDAQVLINPKNSGIIPNVWNRLRHSSPFTLETLTLKASGHEGNVVVGLATQAGIIIFYVKPEFESTLSTIVNWGIAPVIKEVPVEKIVYKDREVIREVPAPSLWKRIFG